MDASGKELTARDLWQLFDREYGLGEIQAPVHHTFAARDDEASSDVRHDARGFGAQDDPRHPGGVRLRAEVALFGRNLALDGHGNGPIDAFVNGLAAALGYPVRVLGYHEHSVGSGSTAQAIAYLELRINESRTLFGVGLDPNIVSASLKAIVSGVRRAGPVDLKVPASSLNT